jgi:hypothetical protein
MHLRSKRFPCFGKGACTSGVYSTVVGEQQVGERPDWLQFHFVIGSATLWLAPFVVR